MIFFITFIIMCAVVVGDQARQALNSGTAALQSSQAYMAALSGVDYVKRELDRTSSWGMNGAVSSLMPIESSNGGLRIVQRGGSVFGYLDCDSKGSYSSYFVVSMSGDVQDSCRYLSCNNLAGNAGIPKSAGYRRDVPSGCFYVVSKGVCGKRVRYVEAMLNSLGAKASGGGTTVAGNISISGTGGVDLSGSNPFLVVRNVDSSKSGNMTAFGGGSSVRISSPSSSDPKSVLSLKNKVTVNAHAASVGSWNYSSKGSRLKGLTVNTSPNVDPSVFESMNTYEKATSQMPSTCEIQPGTYVFLHCSSDNSSNRWVRIENSPSLDAWGGSSVNAANASSLMEGAVPAVECEGFSFGRDGNSNYSRTVRIGGNVKCDGSVKFMALEMTTPSGQGDGSDSGLQGASFSESPLTVDFFMDSEDSTVSPSFVSRGDLDVCGEVTGMGKLYSGGRLAFNSGSKFETKRNSGVAVWSDGSVIMRPSENVSSESYKEAIPAIGKAVGAPSGVVKAVLDEALSGEGLEYTEPQPPSVTLADGRSRVEVRNAYDRKGRLLNFDVKLSVATSGKKKNDKITLSIVEDGKTYSYSGKRKNFYDDGSSSTPLLSFKQSGGSGERKLYKLALYKDWYYNGAPKNGSYYNYGLFTEEGDFICEFDVRERGRDYLFTSTSEERWVHYKKAFGSRRFRTVVDDASEGEADDDPATVAGFRNIVKRRIADSTELKGTILSANGDLNVDASGFSFSVLGSLIAPNGSLTMKNLKRGSIVYDPDYVMLFGGGGIIPGVLFEASF